MITNFFGYYLCNSIHTKIKHIQRLHEKNKTNSDGNQLFEKFGIYFLFQKCCQVN